MRANNTTDTYAKDPQNQLRPNKIDTKVTSTSAIVWSSGVYSYDGAGNVVKMGSSGLYHTQAFVNTKVSTVLAHISRYPSPDPNDPNDRKDKKNLRPGTRDCALSL